MGHRAPGLLIGKRTYCIETDFDPAPVPAAYGKYCPPWNRKYQRQGWNVQQPVLFQWKRMPPVILKKRIESWCDDLATTAEGSRNDLLHWTACRLGEIVAAGRITYRGRRSRFTGWLPRRAGCRMTRR